MSQTTLSPLKPEAAALNAAFTALETYDQGSSRGALVPIDQAVKACLGNETARATLEQRLVSALQRGGSAPAVEFLCSKLTMIGGKSSVAALASFLGQPEFANAARNALEAIPDAEAAKALRNSLAKIAGLPKVGVINSLGVRRDPDSVGELLKLLKHGDMKIVSATVAALGDIATARAARALERFQARCPDPVRDATADAILVCAARLLGAGDKTRARALYRSLAIPAQPEHVQQAAKRGLESCFGSSARLRRLSAVTEGTA